MFDNLRNCGRRMEHVSLSQNCLNVNMNIHQIQVADWQPPDCASVSGISTDRSSALGRESRMSSKVSVVTPTVKATDAKSIYVSPRNYDFRPYKRDLHKIEVFNDDRPASTRITIMSTALLSRKLDAMSQFPARRKYGSIREELNRWIGPCVIVVLFSIAILVVVICALADFVCCSSNDSFNVSEKDLQSQKMHKMHIGRALSLLPDIQLNKIHPNLGLRKYGIYIPDKYDRRISIVASGSIDSTTSVDEFCYLPTKCSHRQRGRTFLRRFGPFLVALFFAVVIIGVVGSACSDRDRLASGRSNHTSTYHQPTNRSGTTAVE